MLDVALDLINKGYHIFQVKPNDKAPLTSTAPKGCNNATSDPDTVRKWFTKYPNANIGIKCDNVLALDLDVKPKQGIDGTIDVVRIQRELGDLSAAPRVETPSGGYHLYFRLPDGVKVKGNTKVNYRGKQTGIDIRVGSQYVVAPGSTIDGLTYNGVLPPVSELPEMPQKWIDNFLPKRESEPTRSETPKTLLVRESSRGGEFDNDSRARAYVSRLEPAISGQNGHNQFFWATRVIFWGWRLSDEQAWTLLREYNEICQPPFNERELQHKVESVKNTKFSKPYGWLADEERLRGKATLIKNINDCNDPIYNPFAQKTAQPSVAPGAVPESRTEEQRRIISITGKELCAKQIKYPEFVIEPWFRQSECALIYAQRGIGKSWFALGLAKVITSGGWAFGSPVWQSPKPRHVLYLDGEMAGADLQQRAKSLNLDLDLVHFVNQELSGLEGSLDLYQDADQLLVLDEAIRVGAEVIIVDNIATLYFCEKPNDSGSWHKYNQFILACRRAGIAVIFIDHCGKNNEMGASGSHAKQNIVNHCIRLDKLSPLDGEGSRFIVRFEKSRSCYGSAITSLTLAVKDGKLHYVEPRGEKQPKEQTSEATDP